jgi:hypothetical protein
MPTKTKNRPSATNGQPPAPSLQDPPLVVLSLTQERANKVIQLCTFCCQTGNLDAAEIAVELAKSVREASQLTSQQQTAAQRAE